MKLYLAAGRYVGTQAEAKAIDKGFEQVEVPTDKEGLIGYLNQIINAVEDLRPADDQFETVVARQDPPVSDQPITISDGNADDVFEAWPLPTQLRLAVSAIDRADALIRGPGYAPRGFGGKPVDPVMDELKAIAAEQEGEVEDPLFS